MKICQNCNIEFPDELNFCSKCGSKLSEKPKMSSVSVEDLITKANMGDPIAQEEVGTMYLEGTKIKKDLSRAFMYFNFSAHQNNMKAARKLGTCYINGDGCEANHHEALKWLEKAYAGGEKESATNIAFLYFVGEGIPHDYSKAFSFALEGAQLGDPVAMYQLHLAYLQGHGTNLNLPEAIKWLEKSADSGYENALLEIARRNYEGDMVVQDLKKALMYYLKLAEKGNTYGMYSAGWQLIGGEGCLKDENQGLYWMNMAAEKGDENAIQFLQENLVDDDEYDDYNDNEIPGVQNENYGDEPLMNENNNIIRNHMFSFPPNTNYIKLIEAVNKYNEVAMKYGGYGLLTLDTNRGYLAGNFRFKDTDNLPFMKSVKITYQNNVVNEEYNKVIEIAQTLGMAVFQNMDFY